MQPNLPETSPSSTSGCSICRRALPDGAGPTEEGSCSSCDRLLQLIRRRFPNQHSIDVREITFQASFHEDLGCDSLDTTELIVLLEMELRITLPDEAPERSKTVGDLVRLVGEQQSRRAA